MKSIRQLQGAARKQPPLQLASSARRLSATSRSRCHLSDGRRRRWSPPQHGGAYTAAVCYPSALSQKGVSFHLDLDKCFLRCFGGDTPSPATAGDGGSGDSGKCCPEEVIMASCETGKRNDNDEDRTGNDSVGAVQHQLRHRLGEKAGLKAAERAAESLVEHAVEASPKGASAVGRRRAGAALAKARRAAGKTTALTRFPLERAAREAAESVAESAAKRSSVVKAAVESGSDRFTEFAASRAGKETEGRVMERIVEAGLEQTERSFEKSGVIAGYGWQTIVEQTPGKVTKQLGRKTGETSTDHATVSLLAKKERFPLKARLGRRTLIALPLLGGLFAAHICNQDRKRCIEALGMDPPNRLAGIFFGTAAAADAADAAAHILIAAGIALGWEHATILMAEYVSLTAAGSSILLAVGGELASRKGVQRRKARGVAA